MSRERRNRLSTETSPYLLQHAANPVDWYPWGPEALALAKQQRKPIFLSIGYSACHWCHVMERECFENPEIAAAMNDRFVNIKVDREERPDLDEIYMTAVQVLTGSGGWPLSLFLTPELHPFYGGTYFPPRDMYGRPGFKTVLLRIADVFAQQGEKVVQDSLRLTEFVRGSVGLMEGQVALDRELVDAGLQRKTRRYDPLFGGFGTAPKFPPSFVLELLARQVRRQPSPSYRDMLENTLTQMARGGMYDQLGGGFHRYSTDERWLVPHFEKMLYDNALLVPCYLQAGRLLGLDELLRIARQSLDWVAGEMIDPAGGIWSTQDADSEGVEGKFFVWDPREVEAALGSGEDARLARTYWDVSEGGNWHEMPGKSVLHVSGQPAALAKQLGLDEATLTARLAAIRERLAAHRKQRVPPGTDTKVLTAWNGLMISALAQGAEQLDEARWLELARGAARFCLERMRGPQGLLRTYRDGKAHLNAYQEDYAYLVQGLVDLHQASQEPRWLEAARTLADEMIARFWDEAGGGFFFTSHDHEALIARTKSPMDNAVPSGNSVAARALLRLAALLDRADYRAKAEATLQAFAPSMKKHPEAFGNMLAALDQALAPPSELVLVGAPGDPGLAALCRVAASRDPGTLLVVAEAEGPAAEALAALVPLVRGKTMVGGAATAYLCRGGACQAPETDPARLEAALAAFHP